jgi:predicted GNAT family acetyltransferase
MDSLNISATQDAQAFLHLIRPSLERDEAGNGLMLGICQQLADAQQKGASAYPIPPIMLWVGDNQGLTAAGLMTPPYPMILYCESIQKIAFLKPLLAALSNTHLPGVIGKKHVAETFANLWRDQTGCVPRIRRSERVFKLSALIPTKFIPGYLRLATETDSDLVIEWAHHFDLEALDGEEGEAVNERTHQRIANKEVFLWVDGVTTAMAIKTRATAHGVTLASVYTPPELRGRGYASALVGSLSQYLLNQGATFCTLMTDLANPISNHIYQKLGYQPVCDIEDIQFLSASH